MVVSELVAELGLDVKTDTFAAGQKGLDSLAQIAVSLTALVERLDAKLAGVGSKMAATAEAAAVIPVGGAAAHAAESLALAPALPPGYNAALEEEKAKILRAKDAAVLHTQATKELAASHEIAATGIQHASHTVERLVQGFLALEGVHLLREFVEQMVTLGTSVERTAVRLGVTTEAVQELRYAAGQFNVDAGTLDNSLRFLQTNAVAAAAGSKEQAAAFKQVGVSVKDASGNILGTEDLFTQTAEGLSKIEDPAKRTAAAVKIFGRGANELIPFLAQGAEGIAKYREEAKKLGGGFSEEAIEQSAEMEHATKRLDFALTSLKGRIALFILPAFERMTEVGIRVTQTMRGLTDNTEAFKIMLEIGLAYAARAATLALLKVTAAQWAQVQATAVAIAEFALIIAGIVLFAAVVEDLDAMLSGNESQIGEWLDQWLGIGTVNDLVTEWSAGIDTLKHSLDELGNAATLAWRLVSNPAGLAVDALTGKLPAGQQAVLDDAAQAAKAVAGAGSADPVARADGRSLDANAIYDQGTPRAVARGLEAGLAPGSAGFGRASASAVGGTTVTDNSKTEIHVHAKTDAKPHEIAHVVRAELHAHDNRKHKQVHAALVAAPDPA